MSTAEAAKVTTSSARSQVGPIAATVIAPRAKPVRTVSWLIARSNERPIGKRSAGSRWARLAARAPAKIGAMMPVRSRRPRSAPTGRPGISMAPMQRALSRSQITSTRRAGNRSAIEERTIPPSA
jgi:hypothetical protein